MIDYTALFTYYDGKDQLPEGAFKISPSSIVNFFNDKTQWYYENLLGSPKKFTGSTSTVLGTCVHSCAEVVANAKMANVQHDSTELSEAVEKYISTYDNRDDYDTDKIRSLWYNMSTSLISEFVLNAHTVATENFIQHEVIPGVFIGGTYDAITSSAPNDNLNNPVGRLTVRDYKTASSKPGSFSYGYKLQAFTYAWILHQKGIKISEVELCYVTQPTKTLPIRTFNFKLPFDNNAYTFIDGIIHLIADSVQVFKDYPDIRYLLMCDYRQKINDIPRPEIEVTEEVSSQEL